MFTLDSVLIFTKTTDLSAWFEANNHPPRECFFAGDPVVRKMAQDIYDANAAHYTKEREVQLIVQACFKDGKTYCCIKCPINPLPVTGWFETPSIGILRKSLKQFGWEHKHTIPKSMLHV